MTFANPLPWWLLVFVIAGAAALAWRTYARTAVPLSDSQRRVLVALRLITLLILLAFLMRPVRIDPSSSRRDAIVPILVDVSRSMRLTDMESRSRLEAAASALNTDILPALSREFRTEVLGFGDELQKVDPAQLTADARSSDLSGALTSLRERYGTQTIAAIVVISDGGDTGSRDVAEAAAATGLPVMPVGVGNPQVRDREVSGVTASDPALAESAVDLTASIVSQGFGDTPVEVRVLENGRPLHVRRVTPTRDGSPIREQFLVSPQREAATLYTVQVTPDSAELTPDNNSRSVLIRPPGRKRRILMLQGAPGFEHSFLARAWLEDQGLELASVVRKGKNEQGQDTFYIQAPGSLGAALSTGFPSDRQSLFSYDAIVLANIEADFFSQEQLGMISEFVGTRGGGLLVMGARSFSRSGLVGTPLEEVVPVELTDRGGGVVRASATPGAPNKLVLTEDGEAHPIMQLGVSQEETRKRWAAVPALASIAALGAPRPGATVLAVAAGPGGTRPLVAVQRYGRGRTMAFSGEAAWRWRMLVASSDRTYETFWRQAVRWLSTAAPDPIALSVASEAGAGENVALTVTARDGAFVPVSDATVAVRVTSPGGDVHDLQPALTDAASGGYAAQFPAAQPGVYTLRAEARRRGVVLGVADDWVLVGGTDREMVDPRLNEEVLRRLASASGGEYLRASDASRLSDLLVKRSADPAPPTRRDLWHNGWMFATILLLLFAEWVLRRRVGLR